MVYDHSIIIKVIDNDLVGYLTIHTKSDYICETINQLNKYNGRRWFGVREELVKKGIKFIMMDEKKRIDIGFTGTKNGLTFIQKQTVKWVLTYIHDKYNDSFLLYFRHGECVGADEQSHLLALNIGYQIIIHPPIKEKYKSEKCNEYFSKLKAKGYLERDRRIVETSQLLIACPKDDNRIGGGTCYTINYAISTNCPVRIIQADGSMYKG